jgi:CRP-like cAMP-binding protein
MSLTPRQMEVLSCCFLFQSIPREELTGLLEGLVPEAFPAGTVIYSRSRFRKAMGILLEGRVTVLKGKDLILNTLGPGQCFGVAALFCPAENYVTTVLAKIPAVLVFLSDDWLSRLFQRYPQTAVSYISFLSQRIRFLNQKIDSFAAPSAQEGLYRHLLSIQVDGRAVVSGGYSQLARALNMGRASLYRSLESLEEEGRIRREGKTIYLTDMEKEF